MNNEDDNAELLLKSLCHINVIDDNFKNDYNNFISNYNSLDIILFHLIQIGEIVSKFSENFITNYKNIDFINIKGLRNFVIHDYTGVIYDEIFDIVLKDIPILRNSYQDILTKDYGINNNYIEEYINYYMKNRKFKNIKTSMD